MNHTFEVGEKVVIANNNEFAIPYYVDEVVKVTKTQITVKNGKRFLLSTLKEIGSTYFGDRLAQDWNTNKPTTVEQAEKSNQEWRVQDQLKKMRRALMNTQWGKIEDDIVKAVFETTYHKAGI